MTAHPLDEKKPERRGRKPERRRDLFLRLAAEIDSGRLTGKLPGVLKLAEQYHSSHGTVQNTLRMLAEAGYLEIQPRSGSYVRRRLEAVMVGLYVENQKVLNLPDAYTNFMANMGPLYQSLHDTLSRAGVPLSFEVAEAGNAEMVRRLKRPDRHLIINFPILEPERYYSLFDGCAWTRISGTFDPDCPSAHFACDNPAIGRLAARRLRERGCRRFISIGSLAIGLFRQHPSLAILGGKDGMSLAFENGRMTSSALEERGRFAFVTAVNRAPMWIRKDLYDEKLRHIAFDFAPFQYDDYELCMRAWCNGLQVGWYHARFKSLSAGGMRLWNRFFTRQQCERNGKRLYELYHAEAGRIARLVEEANEKTHACPRPGKAQ